MSVPLQNPEDLWRLPIEDFNRWRVDNDLPLLFELFCLKLPKFDEWLSLFNLDKRCFLIAPHTGEWFIGKDELIFVEYTREGALKASIEQLSENLSQLGEVIIISKKNFIPYLAWAKK